VNKNCPNEWAKRAVATKEQCWNWAEMRRNDVPLLFWTLNAVPVLLADTAVVFLRASVKSVAVRYDFRAQNRPKCVCGRGLTTDRTGHFPRPLAGFQGAAPRQGRAREERGRMGRGGGKGKGSVHLLFNNLTTDKEWKADFVVVVDDDNDDDDSQSWWQW